MEYRSCIVFLLAVIVFPLQAFAQISTPPSYFLKLFDSSKANAFYKKSIDYSSDGNAYSFMSLRAYLGANNALISTDVDLEIIDYQRMMIDNIINVAGVSKDIPNNLSPFKDKYKGWISHTKNSTYNEEVILYEGYSFFYIAQFLFRSEERRVGKECRSRWSPYH